MRYLDFEVTVCYLLNIKFFELVKIYTCSHILSSSSGSVSWTLLAPDSSSFSLSLGSAHACSIWRSRLLKNQECMYCTLLTLFIRKALFKIFSSEIYLQLMFNVSRPKRSHGNCKHSHWHDNKQTGIEISFFWWIYGEFAYFWESL